MLSRARSKAVVGSIALAFLIGALATPVAAHDGEHTGCSGPAHEMSAATRALHTAWRDARSELGSLERDVRSAFSDLDRDARADLREVLSGAGRQVDHAARDARWAIRDVFVVELTACAQEDFVLTLPSPAQAEYDEIVAAVGTLMEEIAAQARADVEALLADASDGVPSEEDAVKSPEDEQRAERTAERRAEKEKRLAEKQAEREKRLAEKQAEKAKRQAEREAEKARRLAERADRDGDSDEGEEPEDEEDEEDED